MISLRQSPTRPIAVSAGWRTLGCVIRDQGLSVSDT